MTVLVFNKVSASWKKWRNWRVREWENWKRFSVVERRYDLAAGKKFALAGDGRFDSVADARSVSVVEFDYMGKQNPNWGWRSWEGKSNVWDGENWRRFDYQWGKWNGSRLNYSYIKARLARLQKLLLLPSFCMIFHQGDSRTTAKAGLH